jgi:hypothetical protein
MTTTTLDDDDDDDDTRRGQRGRQSTTLDDDDEGDDARLSSSVGLCDVVDAGSGPMARPFR